MTACICASFPAAFMDVSSSLTKKMSVLVVQAETRFYGAFIIAGRVIELKEALQQIVMSSVFNKWAAAQSSKIREEAAAVKSICLDKEGLWRSEA